MKRRIFALVCALVFSCPLLQVSASDNQNSISAVDGNVTVSCVTEAAEGTPVTVFILPKKTESGNDITAEDVQLAQTKVELDALKIEYVASVKAQEGGIVSFNCKMRDSLSTGMYHVWFSFLGSNGYYIAGSFEHVDKDDINALVAAFNTSAASGYSAIIDGDSNGVGVEPAKKILKNSLADDSYSYYFSLENTSDFCNILFSLKPEEGFEDLLSLVSAFNEACAWNRLWYEEDTLSVLSAYNGTESGDYWNLDIAEDSDFDGLSENEKSEILYAIRAGKYTDNEKLEEDFESSLVLALFRETDTREKLEDLIKEDGDYSSYFEKVREIISEADLSEYKTSKLYNNVLDENSDCTTFDEIEELFEESVPEEESSSKGGSSVGVSGGYKSNTSTGINLNSAVIDKSPVNSVAESETPFTDVEAGYWASEYIAELFKKGAINGVGENSFAPNGLISRQDFVKILIGALSIDLVENESAFSDVESGAYYEAYVTTAFSKGLISGVEADKFGVGMNIKREDAAVIMARVLENYGVASGDKNIAFTDSDDMASYAKEAVKKVSDAGIFGGDDKGAFNPKANLTRAETCAILYRLADIIKGV